MEFTQALLNRIDADDQKYLAGERNDDERQAKLTKLAKAIVMEMDLPEHRLNYAEDYTSLLGYLRRIIADVSAQEN